MMKAPKTVATYCPKCRKHTEHNVTLYKKGRDRKLAKGNRRSVIRKRKGYGGQRDPRQRKFSKTTKKQTAMLKCKVCDYTIQGPGIRLKTLELVS